jgi:hypothetical protein
MRRIKIENHESLSQRERARVMREMNEPILWQIRQYVYHYFVETTYPPDLIDTADLFGMAVEEAGEYYKELHNRHALFLDLENLTVRMANPFSGIPTDFKVHANGKTYYANCAWDMLGIPAALHTDAVIKAVCTESNELVNLEIKNGQVTDSDLFVHFPLPFSHWYDDLVFT